MEIPNDIVKTLNTGLVARLTLKGVDMSPIDAKSFWLKILSVLGSEAYLLNSQLGPVTFVVDPTTNGSGVEILQEQNLRNFFDTGQVKVSNIIHIGGNERLITPTPYDSLKIQNTDEVIEQSTSNQKAVFAIVRGNELTIFFKGEQIKIIADILSLNPTGVIRGSFPITSYRTIINAHYKNEIKGERKVVYWHNKAKKLLMASPEKIFRTKLGGYLGENISDGFVDQECLNDNTNDRTDIRVVVSHTSDIYILEIKWIGKSTGANFDNERANDKSNEGINQLHHYVKQEARCTHGILVVYDARQIRHAIQWNDPPSNWDKRIDQDPFFLALDPESASTKAKAEVEIAKKKKPK